MSDLTVKHDELSADEFIFLWQSVWGQGPSYEQTKLAMIILYLECQCLMGNRLLLWQEL